MKTSNTLVWLCALIVFLAIGAAGAGLFWQQPGSSYNFETLRGQTVQIYGQGLYQHDTLFQAAGNKGTDVVTLFLAVPILALLTALYRRGSLRAGLLLTSILAFFLYVYASLALSAAYNPLFLIYVALFSSSLFALTLALRSIDLKRLSVDFSPHLPRRGPAAFMFISGAVTLILWLAPIMGSLITGEPPKLLDSYSTMVTYALDLAVIVPSTLLCGALILRRVPVGYVLAFPLLGIILLLGPAIAAQTLSQLSAGVSFSPAEIAGPIAGFAALGLVAIWLIVSMLRNVSSAPVPATPGARPARLDAQS